ncbi:hypothetical protein PR048_018601 [Dryococelus australis]|uniref:Endonuclease/exonuclease/phosphatase domain-containing protein n=1 Tax=Dryococelus australis TaxID=614101 RepID=A0ABQ9HDH1_9NEOP|nr:hypothetical protein PR048_018601 [Dryococelus australis]
MDKAAQQLTGGEPPDGPPRGAEGATKPRNKSARDPRCAAKGQIAPHTAQSPAWSRRTRPRDKGSCPETDASYKNVERKKKVPKSAARRVALSLASAGHNTKKENGGNSGSGGDRAENPKKNRTVKRSSPQKGSSGPPAGADNRRPAEESKVFKTSQDVNAAQATTSRPPPETESGGGQGGQAVTVPLIMPVVEPRKPHDEAVAMIMAIGSMLGNIPAVEGEAAIPAICHCLEKLRGLVGEQYQTSVRLQGRMEAVVAVHRQQAHRQEAPMRRPTFAAVLAGGGAGASAPLPPQVARPTAPKRVVVIQPVETGASATLTKERIIKELAPEESSLRVRAMRPIAGGGIAVEVADEATLNSVRRLVSARPEQLKVREIQKQNPSVVVYDVPRAVASPEGLVDAIFGKNLSTEAEARGELLRGFKIRRKFGNKQAPEVNVVVQCAPALRNLLVKEGRLYVGLHSCRRFGHHSVRCKAEKPTCGFCGEEGHDFNTCPKKGVEGARPSCANCCREGLRGPTDHQATARNCPIMERSITAERDRLAALLSDTEKDADILLVQEPYSVRGRFPGLRGRQAFVGEHPMAGIVVRNPGMDVMVLNHLSDAHHVCVQITTSGGGEIYLVSSYFQHADDIEVHLSRWAVMLRAQHGKGVILSADANAKGELWHSPAMNARGDRLTEFVLAHDLHVANLAGQPATFVSDSCGSKSNIDVTLATVPAAGMLADWMVTYDSSSDHRLIRFSISPVGRNEMDVVTIPRTCYIHKGTDWRVYDRVLLRNVESRSLQLESTSVDERAEALAGIIKATSEEVLHKRAYAPEYFDEVRETRLESWRRFVEVEGNKDPWGIVYRVAAGKLRTEGPQYNIHCGGTMEMGSVASAVRLLDALLPGDDPTGERPEHGRIREMGCLPPDTEDTAPFTEQELTAAVYQMGNRKAPGIDGITAEILKRAYPRIKAHLLALCNECLAQGKFPRSWKIGLVRVLYKGDGRDPGSVKSYRALSLLSVLAKVFEKVRVTFSIFSCVWERLKLEVVLTHDLVQFLSGHGNFKAKLHELGLVDDPHCDDCLVPHTMAHVLYDCVRIEDLREILKWKLSLLGLDFDLAVIKAADSDAKALLSEFARKIPCNPTLDQKRSSLGRDSAKCEPATMDTLAGVKTWSIALRGLAGGSEDLYHQRGLPLGATDSQCQGEHLESRPGIFTSGCTCPGTGLDMHAVLKNTPCMRIILRSWYVHERGLLVGPRSPMECRESQKWPKKPHRGCDEVEEHVSVTLGDPVQEGRRCAEPDMFWKTCPYLLSSETTAKGTGLEISVGKEDRVELDSSLALAQGNSRPSFVPVALWRVLGLHIPPRDPIQGHCQAGSLTGAVHLVCVNDCRIDGAGEKREEYHHP